MQNLFIAILYGTTREGRKSYNAAKLIEEVGNSIEGISVELLDPREYDIPSDGNKDLEQEKPFTDKIALADGFFIVTPEYNHGYPPSIKAMLDVDSAFQHYKNKPVAFGGVSDGPWGGVRVIEALSLVVRTLGMYALRKDVHFPKIDDIFDESGILLDENYKRRVSETYKELIWKAKALKWARENLDE